MLGRERSSRPKHGRIAIELNVLLKQGMFMYTNVANCNSMTEGSTLAFMPHAHKAARSILYSGRRKRHDDDDQLSSASTF